VDIFRNFDPTLMKLWRSYGLRGEGILNKELYFGGEGTVGVDRVVDVLRG